MNITKAKALLEFMSSFGLPAYVSTSVPHDAPFPRLTYDPVFDSFGTEVAISVNLWYRTVSEAEPNAKAMEISKAIGMGGRVILCNEGAIWIKRGSPFCQNLSDPDDSMIKRRYINLTLEYITQD